MSASRHSWPRAAAAALLLGAAACGGGGGGGGGGGSDIPAPLVKSITPASGFSGSPTDVVISGDNFLFSPTSTQIRAWLYDPANPKVETDLVGLTRVDVHTLQATVPAGLTAGAKTLAVQNAFQKTGTLAGAFTVESLARGALAVQLAAVPTSGNIGQSFTLQATIQNVGAGDVTGLHASAVATSTDGGAATVTGPQPASVATLAAGAAATFTWTVELTAAGHLTLTVTGDASDGFSGLEVPSPPATVSVLAQLPAGLVATVSASRATVNVRQPVAVTFTVTNGGQAAANLTSVSPSGIGSCGPVTVTPAVSAQAPVTVPSGASRSFSWTCTPSAAGALSLSGSATGTDANSGQPVSAAPATPAAVTVQTAAALSAAIAVVGNPTTASVGQALTVSMTVHDTGGASADVSPPTLTPSGATAACGSVSPATPQIVAGGGSVVFTATCTPATTGTLHLAAGVGGSDQNTGATLSATANLSPAITVQQPPVMVVTVGASPTTVDVGQQVSVTFTVFNGGGARALGVTVTPSLSGTASTTCGNVAPGATDVAASGGSQVYTLQCTPSGAGSLVIAATAAGTDANSGQPVTATTATNATITVQTAAALAAAVSVDGNPTTVSVGQALTVRLTVSDTGGASARVTAVTPSPAGLCTAASPAPPQIVTPGGPATFTWTCTPSAAGPLTLGASASGVDINNGGALSASASAASAINVETPPALVATVGASAATVNTAQDVTVTFTVTNGGGAQANGVAVTPSVTGGTCTAAAPTTASIAANGGSQPYTWTCRSSTAGTLTVSGTAAGTDANSGQRVTATPATAATVAVQTPAALAAAIAIDGNPTTATIGQALTVRLTVSDTGGASGMLSSVTPTPAGVCAGVTPLLPQIVSPGSPVTFAWTCTPSTAGSLSPAASVAGSDRNTGAALSASATHSPPITVQTPPALTATVSASRSTVDVGQSVTMTFTVTNGGGAQANGVAVAPSVTGGTCGAVTPAAANIAPSGGSQAYTWTCSSAAAGTLVVSGTATGTDANTQQPVSATPATGASVSVQTPAALNASLAATTPTTITVAQTVSLSLTVTNAGGGNAQVTAVVPSPASGVVSCPAAPAQPLPVTLAGGGSATFTWTCTGSSAGTATLDATVTASNVNTGVALSPAVTGVGVTVQAPGQLAIAIAAAPTTANTGQPLTVNATFTNAGGTAVAVSALTGTIGPVTGTCGSYSTTLTVPFTVPAGGGQVTGTWTCSASTIGAATLGATVTASVTPTITTDSLTIQTPATTSVTGALTGVPSTVIANQAVPVTFTLTNAVGGATAQVSAITPTITGVAGSCTPVTVTPFNLAGGSQSSQFSWTCTPTAAGTATLDATVTATDLNLVTSFTPAVPTVSVTVSPALALTGTLSGTPTPNPLLATAPGSVALTLVVTNPNPVAAQVTEVAPTAIGTAPITCSGPVSPAASPTAPVTIAGNNATQQFTWTCTYTGTGGSAGESVQLGVTVQASLGGAPTIAGMPVNAALN